MVKRFIPPLHELLFRQLLTVFTTAVEPPIERPDRSAEHVFDAQEKAVFQTFVALPLLSQALHLKTAIVNYHG